MKSLLTVPIQCSSIQAYEEFIIKLPKKVDAYEIWIDHLKPSEQDTYLVEQACKHWKKISNKKLVVVCKDIVEMGKFKCKPIKKIQLLLAASRGGANYVDIGLHTGKSTIRKLITENVKSKVIVSFHDFTKTPSQKDLDSISKEIHHLGADVIKIASQVNIVSETERLMEKAIELKEKKFAHIILGMGKLGLLTRKSSNQIGNELNFVTLYQRTAPGQLSISSV